MPIIAIIAQLNTLLDLIAIVCCLVILLFLMHNRRKYGSMILPKQGVAGGKGFAGEVAMQMVSQQSQKAYANLQRSLHREFEALRIIAGGSPSVAFPEDAPVNRRRPAPATAESRDRRYRRAEQMIAQKSDAAQIMLACGLGEGELMLLQGIHKLA